MIRLDTENLGIEGLIEVCEKSLKATRPIYDYPEEHYGWRHDERFYKTCSCQLVEVNRKPVWSTRVRAYIKLREIYCSNPNRALRVVAGNALGYIDERIKRHESLLKNFPCLLSLSSKHRYVFAVFPLLF